METTSWERKIIEEAPNAEVAAGVKEAISRLLTQDTFLLKNDANERSLTHRLALELAQEFPEWHIDCEYNRDAHEPKRLNLITTPIQSDDDQGTTVFPDIVVHERGSDQSLLVIEVKKSNSHKPKERDVAKLQAFCHQLGYKNALFLEFSAPTPGVSDMKWVVEK